MREPPDELGRRLSHEAERKAQRRREKRAGVLYAVGTFGIVGWSVAVPTLLCLAIGVWLDRRFQTQASWTLAMLLAGITLGCLNAWYWVSKQQQPREP